MIVRMWEVKALPESVVEALSWICEVALPEIEALPQHVRSEVFSSADNRIVVISRWTGNPLTPGDPPAHLIEGPSHSWDFSPVDR